MSGFETVLQECLYDLEHGSSKVEDCLQRYPHYAPQLEPILLTSIYLARGREARLSPAFKARVRTRLIQQVYARPRNPARSKFTLMRLAASLAVVMLVLLAAGTAYAQRALPGEAFYAWKLASETAWRTVSLDPVGTDLAIAERRLNELIAVKPDPVLYAQTLEAYLQVTVRLRAQVDATNEERIQAVLDAQVEKLREQEILPPESIPGVAPQAENTPAIPVPTPLPVLQTPQVDPTELPQIVPTVEVVPEILSTVQDPPQILPTIDIPSSLP
jgi:hypothetical protein